MKIGKILLATAVATTIASAANSETWSTYGNTTYGSNGTSYSKYGNTTYGSNGTSYSNYGNTLYGR